MNVRGSNRAVEEYQREMERAARDMSLAQERLRTLSAHGAGPPEPAGCCYRWEWVQDALSPDWSWERRHTCGVRPVRRDDRWAWEGCSHPHHQTDEPPVLIG